MSLFVDDDVALMQQYDNLWSEKKYFVHSIQINDVNNLQLISERLFTFGFAQTRSVAPLCRLLHVWRPKMSAQYFYLSTRRKIT